MLNGIFRTGRIFMSKGWIVGLLVLTLTVAFGTRGFLRTQWPDNTNYSVSDALYSAIALLSIATGAVAASDNWELELARWLGMLFWASAVLTVVIQLFREPVHRLLVRVFARNHIIVAGLGEQGKQLVVALRARALTVVIIEPERNHPALEECRRMGAIVLFGEPDDARELQAAGLLRASLVLAIFREESENVRTATAVYQLLYDFKPDSRHPSIRCVLRLTEPGLLDVIRSHRISTNQKDRVHFEILNSHEIAATTMVREAMANCVGVTNDRIIILGLGSRHRLGEMIVLRAAKDHLIAHDGHAEIKLDIHIFDKQALEWIQAFKSRYPGLDSICELTGHECWARKVGAKEFSDLADFDSAFICIANEAHATAQAVMLRRDVLRRGQPIMVRVKSSRSGYGDLIRDPESGWGENIHAIGLEDSLVDPDFATQPELEMSAQAIHQNYRTRNKSDDGPGNKPWQHLEQSYRDSNRRLADRYSMHLDYTDGVRKTRRYVCAYQPDGFTRPIKGTAFLFRFSEEELEALAAREHQFWKDERLRSGWTFGPIKDPLKKTHPLLVDYELLLNEEAREQNRAIIRSIPAILALADLTIIEDRAVKSSETLQYASFK